MGIADRTSFAPDQRLDNVYALWRFCQATGDVAPLRQRWSDIRTLAIRAVQTLDWASAGHFRAGTANRGSAEAANRRFARWVALANAATTLDRNSGRSALLGPIGCTSIPARRKGLSPLRVSRRYSNNERTLSRSRRYRSGRHWKF